MPTIPQQLRQARIDAGRSAQSVADAVGLSQSMISAVELGTRDPKLGDVEMWAGELGLDVALISRRAQPLPERRAAILQLMAEVLQRASEEDVDVWEAELRVRRRHLGLAATESSR